MLLEERLPSEKRVTVGPRMSYVAYCTSCGKQGVGSTVAWKPRLANYKSHIKKKVDSCRIVKHFIDGCQDGMLGNIRFVIVDVINNTSTLTQSEIDSLLLAKEKFWIGTLITQHKGLNGSHDWCRKTRTEREKSSDDLSSGNQDF